MLSAHDLRAPGVNGVSFDLRAGEILGLAGLVGAGRTEVARAIYRANRVHSGSVSVMRGDDAAAVTDTPRSAMRAGVLMIPESRKEQGLLLGRSVRENVSLSALVQVSAVGVRVQWIKLVTFAISGGAAALGGIIDSARVLSASSANGGTALTFTVLAGTVVGGTSILGGEGAIWRTVVGVLFIALIGNGFTLLGWNPLYEQITLGVILLLAVGGDAWSRLRSG